LAIDKMSAFRPTAAELAHRSGRQLRVNSGHAFCPVVGLWAEVNLGWHGLCLSDWLIEHQALRRFLLPLNFVLQPLVIS
jgi:hypothetical protein